MPPLLSFEPARFDFIPQRVSRDLFWRNLGFPSSAWRVQNVLNENAFHLICSVSRLLKYEIPEHGVNTSFQLVRILLFEEKLKAAKPQCAYLQTWLQDATLLHYHKG